MIKRRKRQLVKPRIELVVRIIFSASVFRPSLYRTCSTVRIFFGHKYNIRWISCSVKLDSHLLRHDAARRVVMRQKTHDLDPTCCIFLNSFAARWHHNKTRFPRHFTNSIIFIVGPCCIINTRIFPYRLYKLLFVNIFARHFEDLPSSNVSL